MLAPRCPRCGSEADLRVEFCLHCGSPSLEIGAGSVIADRFELRAELARGGMGWVFRAHDRALDEEVAIKVLPPHLIGPLKGAQRFRKEARFARRVAHPNVCRIYEYGESGPFHFIAMELIDGIDLRRILDRRRRGLETPDALAAAAGIAAGLEAIHEAGVIHRDLKSQNVMLDARGVVRLTDLGIAKDARQPRHSLTGPDAVMGTPEYMSPEQCRGEPLDRRADVYALGILCYELFTGDVPHRGASAVDTVMLQLLREPAWDEALRRGLPEALLEPLQQALDKDRDRRVASAARFAQLLERAARAAGLRAGKRVVSIEPSERRRDRRLEMPIGCWIRVLSVGDRLGDEELTVAENISRGGARVKTSLTGVAVGDRLLFEEIGGPFASQSEVRRVGFLDDGVRRLHLQFIERAAPAHLVGN